MRSSIAAVAIGSRAEAGSSSSSTSGSTAIARAMHSRCCWPPDRPRAEDFSRSLTSSHSAASRSARSTRSPRSGLQAEVAGRPGHVVVDRLGERVGLLEDHPDPAADLDPVDAAAVEVVTVVEQLPGDAEARDRVVHPVQAAQEGRLAAARRPDDRRDHVAVDVQRDALDRPRGAVGDRQVANLENGLAARSTRRCRRTGGPRATGWVRTGCGTAPRRAGDRARPAAGLSIVALIGPTSSGCGRAGRGR